MKDFRRLSGLQKKEAKEILAGLDSNSPQTALDAASRLQHDALDYGLSLRDYLRAAVTPSNDKLDGYETALLELGLPVRDDISHNISLLQASDTFASKPGSRVLFPEVVLDVANWKTRQDQVETVAPMIAQTRSIVGNEMIWMELGSDADDYQQHSINEGAEIPRKKMTYSSRSVKFFKVGAGYEFTYEFSRRASIDILTPFVNRMNRQMEIDKVKHATSILVNGDNVAGSITAKAETDFGGTNGTLDYKSVLRWLTARAKAGYPVDTLIGNYETYIDLVLLFEPGVNNRAAVEAIAEKVGMSISTSLQIPFLNQSINFVISSTAAADTLIGITQGETLEELSEVGSDIAETERLITSQKVVFVRTQNIGYNLVTPKARESFSWAT